jgi:hypothetical protein
MHIHSHPTTPAPAARHSAAAGKAASAQPASETRRKLLKGAPGIHSDLSFGQIFMIAQSPENGSGQRRRPPHPPKEPQPSDDQPEAQPVSIWA